MLTVRREITIDGKQYQVEIDECPIGSPFSVKINNKTLEVTLEHEPTNAKAFSIKVNGKPYRIELSNIVKNAPLLTKVNNVPFKAELKPTTTSKIVLSTPSLASVQIQRPTQLKGEGVISAPMAGRIISIRVTKGDSVKIGSVLCVLEAMKMENEIASPKSGVVEDIKVQEGKAVNEGDVLMLIK